MRIVFTSIRRVRECLGASYTIGVAVEEPKAGITVYRLPPHRAEILEGVDDVVLPGCSPVIVENSSESKPLR